jgi:membrane associated rhomboid family serine protease
MDLDPVDPSGASPDTLRELHVAESRRLRNKIGLPALAFVAALLFWLRVDRQPGSLLFVAVGLALAGTAARTYAWWKHRQVDPLAPSSITPEQRQRAREAVLAHQIQLRENSPYISYGVVGCVTAVALLQVFVSGSIAKSVAAAGLVKPLVNQGQWWRLISASYLHAGFPHFWMNMVALLGLGRLTEAYSPRWRLPLVYATAALGGGVASWLLLPGKSSLGASGAILGLAGYLAFVSWRRPGDVPVSIGRQALGTCALTGFIGATGFQFIDNAAHAGGALGGAFIAWLTIPREKPRFEPVATPTLDALGKIAAGLILIGAIGTSYKLVQAGPDVATHDANGKPDVVTPIRSARISFAKTSVGVDVTIDNLSDRTIEAYTLVLRVDGVPKYEEWRDECCLNNPASLGHGIAPYAGIVHHVAINNTDLSATTGATLTLVLFDDLSFEGTRNGRDKIIARRRQTLSDIDFWLADLDETLTLPVEVVTLHLIARIDERAHAAEVASQSVSIFGIKQLMDVAEQHPQDYPSAVERAKRSLVAQRAALQQRILQ